MLGEDSGNERTHTCAAAAALAPGTPVCLTGWVMRSRALGGVLFLALRDHTGSLQCVWELAHATAAAAPLLAAFPGLADAGALGPAGFAAASEARVESVVSVHGVIRTRETAARTRGTAGGKGAVDASTADESTKSFTALDWTAQSLAAAQSNGSAAGLASAQTSPVSASPVSLACVGQSPFAGVTAAPQPSLGALAEASALPVELAITSLKVLNPAATLPGVFFPGAGETLSDEDTRLKHRYIDLRRPQLQAAVRARARITAAARTALTAAGFTEVETPALVKSTPEGAREFLVPSRAAGAFYALPQSPQQHKQLLMAGGVDRYFQVARCFRDEHGRQDRQPEFTQIDLEMAFVTQREVMAAAEALVAAAHEAQFGVAPALPLPQMPFFEALDRFGSDKPDLRYALPLHDITDAMLNGYEGGADAAVASDALLARCESLYPGFVSAHAEHSNNTSSTSVTVNADGTAATRVPARSVLPCVKALVLRGQAPALSKSKSKDAVAGVRRAGESAATPDGVFVVHAGKWKPPPSLPALASPAVRARLQQQLALGDDDLLLIAAGPWEGVCNAMGRVRAAAARLLPADAPDATPVLLRNSAGTATYAATCEARERARSARATKTATATADADSAGAASAAAGASALTAGVNEGPLPMLHWVTDFPLLDVTVPPAVWRQRSTAGARHVSRAAGGSSDDAAAAAGEAGAAGGKDVFIQAMHHPFTAPHPADATEADALLAKFVNNSNAPASGSSDPQSVAENSKSDRAFPLSFAELSALLQVRAQHYDLVANGLEVGGGSVRLHAPPRQTAVLRTMGVDPAQFEHLLAALGSGCPPHGGFAAGLDRLVALLATGSGAPLPLRDVIAFPKTLTGKDALLGAPAPATAAQLAEYHIATVAPARSSNSGDGSGEAK